MRIQFARRAAAAGAAASSSLPRSPYAGARESVHSRGSAMEEKKPWKVQGFFVRAGDRGRTGDLMLGKHTL